MNALVQTMLPELILIAAACALILMGACQSAAVRKTTPLVALAALAIVFIYQVMRGTETAALADPTNTVRVYQFAEYIKMLSAGVGILFVLLAWPVNRDGTGNAAIDYGTEAGEFFRSEEHTSELQSP